MINALNKLLDWFCNVLSVIVLLLIIAGMAWILVTPIMKLIGITSMKWFSIAHLSVLGVLAADAITIMIVFIIASFVSRLRREGDKDQY